MQIKQDNNLYILSNELEDLTGTIDNIYVSEGMLKKYKEKYPDLNI